MGISKFALAAAAAGLGLSGTAQAVPATTEASGQALILVPLTLTRISDLDFGTIVPSSQSGVVTISASDGLRGFAGGVTGSASDEGNRAQFAGAGAPSQQVFVSVDSPAALVSAGGATIPVLALTLEGSALKTIDPETRAFFFGVGGILQIGANQADGLYSADFTVTANYQ